MRRYGLERDDVEFVLERLRRHDEGSGWRGLRCVRWTCLLLTTRCAIRRKAVDALLQCRLAGVHWRCVPPRLALR